ncbi:hypothetical protein DFS34DRAFT_607954 [Phlyctochytrium arcticum]|nr:hypothetical protein DFS34DRAFT_607954 [Phlyctochytrium arcticum]
MVLKAISRKLDQTFPIRLFPATTSIPSSTSGPEDLPTLFIFPASKQHITSLDVASVKLQAFLAFSNYKHVVQQTFEPDMSPSRELPFLVTSDGRVLTGHQIIEEVKEKSGDLESRLSQAEKYDMKALVTLTESKLGFALLFTKWFNHTVKEEVTLPLHESFHPWPINKLISRSLQAQATEWMLGRKTILSKDELLAEAKDALQILSLQLGDQLYFYGQKASYLDAVIFAHLHIILSVLTVTHGTVPLRQAVLEHENLVKYSRRIFNTFFAAD